MPKTIPIVLDTAEVLACIAQDIIDNTDAAGTTPEQAIQSALEVLGLSGQSDPYGIVKDAMGKLMLEAQ